eukprot:CAMPEP_0172502704 /NCGR_PEP_ID=MMETSP1066-20121228/162111_1 /TAXON_ID=671091 /ORGANISM="Coscinodiscus wailesii, Strain CCMP2513" /LENGTH=398 /DNA_ID=CAMNT_0013278053 /DNA_START=97 /DNA_END=1293 /DNA_ORIENTATION=-
MTSASQDKTSFPALLSNPSRPVFLLGDVPPSIATPPHKCQEICNKFTSRSRALANDGFIVYDIQDEPGRAANNTANAKRPFPFRKLMDSSSYASLLARSGGKPCLVYKCVADANFEDWIETAERDHGHSAINLVGRPTSDGEYAGPTAAEAMDICAERRVTSRLRFGCICIAERHTLECARQRGKTYPTEHLNMFRKQAAGADWFVSQAVYDPEPTVRLLKDYAAVCRERGVTPKKVILTFLPVSRKKTMEFVKWLGVIVPPDAEEKILGANSPVDESVDFLCHVLTTILDECRGVGIPLGVNCESVSIYKAEIDGVHELFRRLQGILLDARGSPWKVHWIEVMPPAGEECEEDEIKTNAVVQRDHTEREVLRAGLQGVVLGGVMVAVGVMLGGRKTR